MLDFKWMEGGDPLNRVSRNSVDFTPLFNNDSLETEFPEPGTTFPVLEEPSAQPKVPTELQAAILAAVQAEASEDYSLVQNHEGYEAISREQGLRAAFTPEGFSLTAPDDQYAPWMRDLEFIGYGYGGQLQPAPLEVIQTQRNRIEYQRGRLTEWYVNGPLGVEQGFTLQERPGVNTDDQPLHFALQVPADVRLELAADQQSVLLTSAHGGMPFHYGHLYVNDAAGHFLPTSFDLDPETHQIHIRVDDRGATYPIVVDPLFQQQAKLTASDGAASDNFGHYVALDGDTAVVGARLANIGGNADAGAVYVFTRSGSTWSQQQKLTASDGAAGDEFGGAVSLEGDTLVVGCGRIHTGSNIGAVYVFTRTDCIWSQQQKLTASDGAAGNNFGSALALQEGILAIGANLADVGGNTDAGAAYIFTLVNGVWSQEAKLTASDGAAGDNLGDSAALDGDTVVIGARLKTVSGHSEAGAAYVFTRSGSTWSQQQKLTASDNAAFDRFGHVVDLEGDTIVVGAYLAAIGGNSYAGAAYVFTRSGSTWSQQQKLTASDGAFGDNFGVSVALSGGTLLVSAHGANIGGNADAGAVYLFSFMRGVWTQQAKLTASDGAANDHLGNVIALSGGTVLVGAWDDDISGNTDAGSAYIFTLTPAAPTNTGSGDYPLVWAGEIFYDSSVNIRTGEKTEVFNDISVNTPVGPMEFVRTYRQSKHSTFQFMGLGWTHNHAATLTKIIGTPNTIIVQMSNGGELHLTETTSNHYVSDVGADTVVDYNSGTTQYTLTATDTSTYVFDSTGKLLSRSWPGGETWSYTYVSGKLTQISDGNDHTLALCYLSHPGQFDDGLLWRVGSGQDSTTLASGSPADPYVEFAYDPQKSNGSTVANPKAVLKSVDDTLRNVWTYKYFGQVVGETTAALLDSMVEVLSPAIDTNGDGGAGTAISIEKLTYTLTGGVVTNITQVKGDTALSTDFVFQAGGQNITTEKISGTTEETTHTFNNGVYGGFTDPEGNFAPQTVNFQYRLASIQDANGNINQLTWTDKGHRVKKIKNALGHVTKFDYLTSGVSMDALDFRTDPDGRRTKFTYGNTNNPRRPTKVQIYDKDGSTLLHWEEFTYNGKGHVLTEKLFDPTGTILQKQTTRVYYGSSDFSKGWSKGHLQTLTQVDLSGQGNDIITTYLYDRHGRVVQTNQNSTFGTCESSYTVYNHTGRVLATICNYVPPSDDMNDAPKTAAEAVQLYDPLFPEKNRVTTYTYDQKGRRTHVTTDAGSAYAVINVTAYDSLNRVKRTIQNYIARASITDPYVHNRDDFDHGLNNDRNLITDLFYNQRGKLRKQIDVLGNVTLFGYNKALRRVRTVQNASQPTYDNDYPNGDPALAWYPQCIALGTPDQDIIISIEYDKAGNASRTTDALGNVTLAAYDKLKRAVKVIRNASRPTYNLKRDPSLRYYDPVSDPDQDLVTFTEYDEMKRLSRQQDELGIWTLLVYDGLGRLIKTIRNPSQPNYKRTADPTFQYYLPSTSADVDLITEMAYDPADRQMFTTDELARQDWTAYDGLNRVVKTIDNAVGRAINGTVDDPRSASYHANDNLSDQDQISRIDYDANGRRWRTRDNLGNYTLYGYDTLKRQVRVIQNASNFAYDTTNDVPLSHYVPAIGAAADQDLITETAYDGQGRVAATVDPMGVKATFTHDALGRQIKTVQNFVTGTYNATYPDQDLVSTSSYNLDGRTTATVDVRGKQTTFVYDRAGRQKIITEAAGTTQAVNTYRCYDKGGRLLRQIQNWINDPTQVNPDARDSQGNWLFNPVSHGTANDQNLITTFTYDQANRQTTVSNPAGNTGSMTYTKAGQTESTTDPLGMVTKYRYDQARRLVLTVQNFQSNGEDPALWKWNGSAWTKSDGSTAIAFGTAKDQNIILQSEYDKAGRRTAMRDPRGNRTTYTYDLLDRRIQTTNPMGKTWTTSYLNLLSGGKRITLTDPNTKVTQHDYDRLGRETLLQYLSESPKLTPDVVFAYSKAGNRLSMTEINGASTVRQTAYTYDDLQRLTQVDFDNDGNGSFDDTVSYGYDAGGLRTRLTLPGSLNVNYGYDILGRLTSLTDWSSQATQFSYDGAQRLASALRANNLLSSYGYDPAGRLTQLRHTANNQTLGHFAYTVDARGNRTQLYQGVPRSTTGSTTMAYNDAGIDYYQGTWNNANPYKTSTSTNANLRLAFLASQVTLTMGKGPDHGIYGIYVDGALQQTVDGYAASSGDQATVLNLSDEGPHTLEVRNTGTKNAASSGFQVRYKTLATPVGARLYDLQTISYSYDGLSRLASANTYPGINLNAAATLGYSYAFDPASNRTQQVVTVAGSPTTTNYTYNAANQLTSDGTITFGYDDNGNATTSNGIATGTYDRANRMLTTFDGVTTVQYAYDGLGNRVKQTVGAAVTQYLLDLLPGLPLVLRAQTGASGSRYVHGSRGLHAQSDLSGNWSWPIRDGLGSVAAVVNNSLVPQESRRYSPYGEPTQLSGSSQTSYGFTGEIADSNGLLYLRARYMAPGYGLFTSLDPVEASNRYAYVNGNPINQVDPSGLVGSSPLMIDVNDGYGVVSTLPSQPATVPPPVVAQVPLPQPPPVVVIGTQPVQDAYANVVNSLNRVTQSCSNPVFRAGNPETCGIQKYLFGTDLAYDAEWGMAYDPRLKVTAVSATGQINTRLLAKNMSAVFGYNVAFNDIVPYNNGKYPQIKSEDAKALTLNLLAASLQTTAYLEDRGSQPGLASFRNILSQTAEGQRVTVYLGANVSTGGAYQGRVPGSPSNASIYIGSNMSAPDITHEFGHQFDKHYNYRASGGNNTFDSYVFHQPAGLAGANPEYIGYKAHPNNANGVPLARTDLDWASETWADYFMTGVLVNQKGFKGTNPDSPNKSIIFQDPNAQKLLDNYISNTVMNN